MNVSPPLKKEWALTQKAFDQLLAWLGPDRELAGEKYEEIRRHLIKIFVCRGSATPEDLADETINRVIRKIPEVAAGYVGNPALYFYNVAQKIHLEYLRKQNTTPPPPPVIQPEDVEQKYRCLDQCMQSVTPNNRALILQYYQEEKQAKIDRRKELAERLGVAVNALRIRACRIRSQLEACVAACLKRELDP